MLTAALTVLSVGALLCCGAAAADEPGAGLRAAETTAVYSAASGLSATLPIQSEPSAGASITEPSAVASIQAESSAVLSAQAEAEKLTARSAPTGAKSGGESGEQKAHSEVSSMSDASLASGAVGELGSGMLEAMPDYAREAAEGIGSDGRGADSGSFGAGGGAPAVVHACPGVYRYFAALRRRDNSVIISQCLSGGQQPHGGLVCRNARNGCAVRRDSCPNME